MYRRTVCTLAILGPLFACGGDAFTGSELEPVDASTTSADTAAPLDADHQEVVTQDATGGIDARPPDLDGGTPVDAAGAVDAHKPPVPLCCAINGRDAEPEPCPGAWRCYVDNQNTVACGQCATPGIICTDNSQTGVTTLCP